MQGAYVTSQHLEGEGVANNCTMENYVHCYKKVRMTHTHTNPELHRGQNPLSSTA